MNASSSTHTIFFHSSDVDQTGKLETTPLLYRRAQIADMYETPTNNPCLFLVRRIYCEQCKRTLTFPAAICGRR